MKLSREILRLALPSILANITVPLVGMVDIAVAGHLPAASAAALIGGISIGAMLFDLLYWNFGFLRAGTGGLTAQAYGRQMADQVGHDVSHDVGHDAGAVIAGSTGYLTGGILLRALRIAVVSGLVLIALQWAVVWLAFLVVECSPEVRELATQYFHIRIWAAPATLSLFAFKGWFIGMQDSVRPMTADLLVNGLNIALSIGLGLSIGFAGVALGTAVAQWAGCIYCIIATARRYRPQFSRTEQAVSGDFFALNRDLFLRSVGLIAVYIGFTVLSARYGDLMLAVSAILMKFLMIFSYFTDGFAYAGEALTGRFIGEESAQGVRSTVRQTFAWSAGVALLFMLLYGVGGVPMFRLMTADASVVDAGRQFLPWLLLMPPIGCAAFLWDGIYIGATASKDLRNSTLLCATGFFAVWLAGVGLVHTPEQAIHLLMGAYFMHLAVRTVYLTLRRKTIYAGISSR